jgi:cytoskeletal protein CcmA (bactofilin family)
MKLEVGERVNEITAIITEPGDDITLATEKAIVDYVTAVSGVLAGATSSQTFVSLTDTPSNYSNTKLVYSTASDIQYADNLSYDGSGLVVSGTLNTTGAVTFDSTLDVDGATTLNDTLDVDGATTLNNTLDVDGATTLNSSLVVSGTTNLQGDTDIDSTLNVDGATTLNDTLDVDGATTLNSSLVVSGTTNLQGDVDIDSTLNVDGTADFNSNVVIDGTLDVDGAVDFDSTLNVASGVVFQSTLNVQGDADFDSDVNVDGATTLNSTLLVVGGATFGNNVVVSGTFQFDDGETVNNISADMTPPGDDDTLLTAGAIWDWVNTVSGAISTGGSLNHNDLQGLQGGASGEYYHLDLTAYTALSGVDSTDVSNWNTAYGWGNHAGLYSLVSHLHDDRYYTETEIDATVSGINDTIATTSGTLQDQIDDITGVEFYDVNLGYVNSTTWTWTDKTFPDTNLPSELQVYVNGLKQKNHADYYVASIDSGALKIVFAFTTYSEDWVNATFRASGLV